MNFVSGLHLSPRNKYAIWVVVDRLTKSTHHILILFDYMECHYQLFLIEIRDSHRDFGRNCKKL
ncbi:integrase [Gossypium australe]|uniref:Integrase n=1 Tax=Gossypium australe TaxID=47621 RepID=A0A5B6VKK0_9ROSI|nr:integrase [Gossypium australe]